MKPLVDVVGSHRGPRWVAAFALGSLLVLTRGTHVATPFALPDATLAVLFLAGLYHAHRSVLVACLLLAAAADAWAIGIDGLSAACLSGGYAFLIPAYACLWCAGRRTAMDGDVGLPGLGRAAARLTTAAALSFLIANASYYACSELPARLTFVEYAQRTWGYGRGYVGAALAYVAIALLLRTLLRGVGTVGRLRVRALER